MSETSREYFSIASFGGKHEARDTKRALQCFGFAQIVQTLCDSRAQFFKSYIPGSQKFISLIHQNFHLNLLRCRCKNSKRFSNFMPPQLPRRRSANSILHAKIGDKCPPLQLRDRGCTWCFFAPKELYVVLAWKRRKFHLESDEVLCSPERLSVGFIQSLIILVDIECIADYS